MGVMPTEESMVKKAKDKAAQPTAGPSKGTKDGGKGKKGQKATEPAAAAAAAATPAVPPPKPTVKQIIGGSSWTGKLPVNLLSEHCQRLRWEKPDYDTRKTPDGFSVWVTLSARDAKTQQLTRLEPFKIPASHKHLLLRETALEAKHAAATYALFRVCNMQNKHTVLPPDHKSLWKEFQALKTQDVKEGKAWMYDADPFKTLLERQESKAAVEKKRREVEAAKAKAKEMPGASGLALLSSAGAGPNAMKGWTTAPKVEMGRQTRIQLEALLRRGIISWNPHGVRMSREQRDGVVDDLSKIGFRRSHVAEAVEYCKDREETLEWLLIHVPEDDLPRWAFPENYAAGVSVGATNLKREGIIKSLSETGYAPELCARVLDDNGGDEGKAAEALQAMLFPAPTPSGEDFLDMGGPEEQWEEEVASLEAMYGDSLRREDEQTIRVRLESVQDAGKTEIETHLRIRRPPTYPEHLILAVAGKLPSYIKLSIIRKALEYSAQSLRDEPLKMYLVTDWVQRHINGIIDDPGKLVDISAVASSASDSRPKAAAAAKKDAADRAQPAARRTISWTADARSRDEWLKRQQQASWKDMESKRRRLPAWRMCDCIVRTVEENDVTIISGETGSGKSTQSVQFILDDLYEKGLGERVNMMVTQPRRISALGLADRVAEERCSRVGHEVGYAIRGESRRSERTRITFVTTGVLLRRLQTSGGRMEDVAASLADVSHVVIDEVHERSLDTDFLLTLMREVLRGGGGPKLVLMSATLDAASFRHYFASEGLSVGLVEIAGRTFPVEEYYLDDVLRMSGLDVEGMMDYDDSRGASSSEWGFNDLSLGSNNKKANDAAVERTMKRLAQRMDYDLLAETVRAIDLELSVEKETGGILVFLPGVAEINQACGRLRGSSSLQVFALHGSLETSEQKRVFGRPTAGRRKVVMATNVAETSITIDDVVAVVDSGKVKETSFDASNNMRRLEERWASRAACEQRRGRAGRVQEGRCYRLYTRQTEGQMAERPEPEIRRVPLEQLCLSVRAMGVRDVAGFLERCPTAPSGLAVEGALRLLGRMGALDGTELTALGRQLATIPADLRCGKLMVLGALLGCGDDCVAMAAILSTRSPFVTPPPEKREAAREARMRFAAGRGDGDVLTDLAAVEAWEEMTTRVSSGGGRQLRAFCEENFLSQQALRDILSTRTQLYSALEEVNCVDLPGRRREWSRDRDRERERERERERGPAAERDPQLLRGLVAAAFAPQVARIQYPDRKYASGMSGAVELDPEARAIKFFTQENGRVFVHPASTLFGCQTFTGDAAYVSYFGIMATSKVFIRDLTPLNAYGLLLFCGAIELDTLGRGLVVDGWIRLRGWARIGVLVARLRGLLDRLLARRVERADTGRMALGAYLDTPSAHDPQSAIIYHTEAFVAVRDLYPKASVHALLLPRDRRLALRHPLEALADPVFRGVVERELPRMSHLHIHVLSRDMRSPHLRHRKHYNSFTTDFFVPLTDMPLSVEQRAIRGRLLRSDLVCWRCGRNFGNRFRALKDHLEAEFQDWRRLS
ncbi:hypothetical protein CP532_0924 [Ophiocordyceps camponoti-leonardi (nom. inval.)]|nr:hypothetical protein CP532_0924 [Ophiocordyceps camponoti-leonardi (nom. inval.)]